MPIEIVKRYTRAEIRANPNKTYVFGDNLARTGYGGQAKEARGEPNALGIPTKVAPTYNKEDFFTDREFANNCIVISHGFSFMMRCLERGEIVVWPADGIGTGIARLQENAPETLKFIYRMLMSLIEQYKVTEDSILPEFPKRMN